MGNFLIEINEWLTKVFQQKCYLVDDSNSVYKLQFPNIVNVIEFEKFKNNAENFLAQYDIEVGVSTITYQETGKIFELHINKIPLNKELEKINLLSQDLQLHAALEHPTLLVPLLLQKEINFNCKNINGETPLQIAEQKNDVRLGKRLIDSMLKKDSTIEKPDFSLQELASYWDEQLKEVADKLSVQPLAAAKIEKFSEKMGDQNIKNRIRFFSRTDSANDKPLEEPTTSIHLGK